MAEPIDETKTPGALKRAVIELTILRNALAGTGSSTSTGPVLAGIDNRVNELNKLIEG